MISFTLKGKNFPPGAKYWAPYYYYTVEDMAEWKTPLITTALISQSVHYKDVKDTLGFAVFFGSTAKVADISGPYAYAATSPMLLKNNYQYVLDFHGEVGLPTLLEEAAAPAAGARLLQPWPPNWGPPLPTIAPPWPPMIPLWQEGWRGELVWKGEIVPITPG